MNIGLGQKHVLATLFYSPVFNLLCLENTFLKIIICNINIEHVIDSLGKTKYQ